MIGYFVPVSHDLFVAIVTTLSKSNELAIYLNTHPQKLVELKKEAENWQDVIFEKDIPKQIYQLAQKIDLIYQGFDQDTASVLLDYANYTVKQIQVIKTAMKIPVNEIWPYSKVAEEAGLPKAQRFVGTTMRVLRQPYIVPVQRVKSISYLRKKERKGRRNFNKMPL